MSDWSPDAESGWTPDAEREAAVVVRVFPHPLRLRVAAVAHDRAKPGETAFATHVVGGKAAPIAVGSLPAAQAAQLLASDCFDGPVGVLLRAHVGTTGLEGVLYALVPRQALERLQAAFEGEDAPWRTSAAGGAPTWEERQGAAGDDPADLQPLALGAIFRFAENRKFPDDLGAEVEDLLLALLGGTAMDADAKKIENLVGGL